MGAGGCEGLGCGRVPSGSPYVYIYIYIYINKMYLYILHMSMHDVFMYVSR